MSTESQSNSNEMISVPREWAQHYADLLEERCAYEKSAQVTAFLAQPAEQHQGEPVAWLDLGKLAGGMAYATKMKVNHRQTPLGPLHDSGEVGRLRANAGQHKLAMDAACGEIEILRAQLAERDALLEEAYCEGWNDGQEGIEQRYQTTSRTSSEGWERFKADNALSASAEPANDLCAEGAHEFVPFRSDCVKCGEPYSAELSPPGEIDEQVQP